MYAIISLFSYYTREFILPNPFEVIINNPIIAILISSLIGESMLHIASFKMCGIFYIKGNSSSLGSVLYFVFYIINIGIIIGIGSLIKNILWFWIIYILTIIVICIVLNKLKTIACKI